MASIPCSCLFQRVVQSGTSAEGQRLWIELPPFYGNQLLDVHLTTERRTSMAIMMALAKMSKAKRSSKRGLRTILYKMASWSSSPSSLFMTILLKSLFSLLFDLDHASLQDGHSNRGTDMSTSMGLSCCSSSLPPTSGMPTPCNEPFSKSEGKRAILRHGCKILVLHLLGACCQVGEHPAAIHNKSVPCRAKR